MKKKWVLFLASIVVLNSAFAQKPVYDSPDNYGSPAEESRTKDGYQRWDFYIPGESKDKSKKPNPFGENMPQGTNGAGDGYTGKNGERNGPDYRTDNDFDNTIQSGGEISFDDISSGGDGTGGDGNGSGNSGVSDGGDFNVGDGKPSIGTSSTSSSPGKGNDFGYENHRGGDGVPKNGQVGRVSRNYPELIKKGEQAVRIVDDKSDQVVQIEFTSESNFDSAEEAVDFDSIKSIYEIGEHNIVGRKNMGEIMNKMISYSKLSIGDFLIPFRQQFLKSQSDYDEYRKSLIKKELDNALPGLHEKNVASLIRAREMIKNWKIAQSKIKQSLFNDLFDQSEETEKELEKQLELTYVGPLELKLLNLLKSQETQGRYRMSQYISSFLSNVSNTGEAQQLPQPLEEAMKLLTDADNITRLNGDMLVVADKILEAKEKVSDIGGGTLDVPIENWIAVAGITKAVGKGFVKYGMKMALQNFVKEDAEATAIAIIGDAERLTAKERIWFGPNNPGILNFLKISGKDVSIASTFKDGVYKARLSKEGEVFYRYFDGVESLEIGRFFSKNVFSTKIDAQRFLALPNIPEYMVEVRLPKGMLIFEGTAGSMKYGSTIYTGDATQIVLPDLSNLKNYLGDRIKLH